ncbi:MAG: ZIP family metal transporter [Anaerolineales bacterium]
MTEPTLADAVIAATLTMLATGLGALPFLFVRRFPDDLARLGWAFAGGIMLSASVFNLIIPGVAQGGIPPVALGVLIGTALFGQASMYIGRHEHDERGIPTPSPNVQGSARIVLILGTMFLHSFPEGLAIGVAYGSGEAALGALVTVAIGIHNIPEGVAVSLPLRAAGVSAWRCVGWSIFSSAPQPLAAIPAFLAVKIFEPFLPFAFGLAAGAMLFLVLSEMIPESRANDAQRLTSALASMAGFLLLMTLTNLLLLPGS